MGRGVKQQEKFQFYRSAFHPHILDFVSQRIPSYTEFLKLRWVFIPKLKRQNRIKALKEHIPADLRHQIIQPVITYRIIKAEGTSGGPLWMEITPPF